MKFTYTLLCGITILLTNCNENKDNITDDSKTKEPTPLEKKLNSLNGRVNLSQVKKLFSDVKPGHGAYFYSKLEGNQEVWFYIDFYTDKKENESSSTDETCFIGAISLVLADDPNEQKFLWPAGYVGLSVEEAFDKLNADVALDKLNPLIEEAVDNLESEEK